MRKLAYLLVAAAVFATCNSGNNGHTVTRAIESAAGGDIVYLQTVGDRQLVKLDSIIIASGAFAFKSTQDTAANRYIAYNPAGTEGIVMDFFPESGKVNIKLNEKSGSTTGTIDNDVCRAIRVQLSEPDSQTEDIYASMTDTALTGQQRESRSREMDALQGRMMEVVKAGISQSIIDIIGVHLLESNYYYLGVGELDPLVLQIPATHGNNATVIRIRENVEKMKATTAGKKFTDFRM